MTAKRRFKSDAFEAIHSSASALLEVGAIDKTTMREFDESCLSTLPMIGLRAYQANQRAKSRQPACICAIFEHERIDNPKP